MPWVPADDSQARCGPDPGGVGDHEHVVKFVSERDWNPSADELSSESLGSDKLCERPGFNDTCGQSDGLSVKRCDHMTAEQLAGEQNAYCAHRQSPSRGVRRASVAGLRAIRLQDHPGAQVVFVLDDPIPGGDKWHAVIRLSIPGRPRPPLEFVRDKIREQFQLVA